MNINMSMGGCPGIGIVDIIGIVGFVGINNNKQAYGMFFKQFGNLYHLAFTFYGYWYIIV